VSIANGLAERNYKVKLILLNRTGILINDLSPRVETINLRKKHVRSSLPAIIRFVRREKPGSILVFNHQLAIQLVITRHLVRHKFRIVSRHISNLIETKANERSFWHKYLVHFIIKLLYRKINLIISQSEGVVEELVQHYMIPRNRIVQINNPVSEKIRIASLNIQNRTKLIDPRVILYVGRLVKMKQVDLLIETFSDCLQINKNLILRICGEGPEKENLIALTMRKGINENVAFLGFIEDMLNVYSKADLLVLTSKYEGFPNVIIEAITIGVPVVSFDCKYGPSEIIRDGVNGYLVPQGNVDLLKQQILFSIERTWDDDKIKETSSNYSLPGIIDRYLELFTS